MGSSVYQYLAKVVRVVDGDTLDLRVDLGFTASVKVRVRLHGVNTPEMHGVKKDSDEYKAGDAARRYVLSWLDKDQARRIDEGDPDAEWGLVKVRSFDGKKLGTGKYGRWIVIVERPDPIPDTPLNMMLVQNGHAEEVRY